MTGVQPAAVRVRRSIILDHLVLGMLEEDVAGRKVADRVHPDAMRHKPGMHLQPFLPAAGVVGDLERVSERIIRCATGDIAGARLQCRVVVGVANLAYLRQ